MMEQIIVTEQAPWYVAYFWEILALTVAPLVGFSVGQYYKASVTPKPSAMRIAMVAGGMTSVAALLCWSENHSWEQSAKIAAFVGILQPIIVSVWLRLADKFAPAQAAMIRGSDDEVTVIPWVAKVKKHGS